MGIINRIPTGFLDIFGAQQQGKNPPQYADFVQPVIDTTPEFLGGTIAVKERTFTHTVVGDVRFTGVITGETWWMVGCSVTEFHSLATEFVRFEFLIQSTIRPVETGVRQARFFVTPLLQSAVINQTVTGAFMFPQPLVLQSGLELGVRVIERDGGAARIATIDYLIYRLIGA